MKINQQRKEDVRFHASYSRVNNTSAKCKGSRLALDTGTLKGIVDKLKNISQQGPNKRDAMTPIPRKTAKHRIAALSPLAGLKKSELKP